MTTPSTWTNGPNPLINNLTNLFMMDSGWTEANGASAPQDVAVGETTFASQNTNGTGAFVGQPRSDQIVLKANPNYWGKGQFPLAVSEIIYTLIQSAATRVAALLSVRSTSPGRSGAGSAGGRAGRPQGRHRGAEPGDLLA